MKMKSIITAVAALSLLGFTGVAEDKPKDDSQLVQGSWDLDPAAKQFDAQMLLERVVIEGDTLTFHYSLRGRKSSTPTEFKLNPKASPKEIDFTPTDKDNANKGKTYFGLYEVKAGQLRICYRGPGENRPKDFNDKQAGTNGTSTMFIVCKPSPRI